MSSTATAASLTPVSRRWLWLVAALSLALAFAQSPGKISPDTKLDLTANPLRFLSRALNLWNSELPFGQAQNQAYGYLFPHGAFFLLGDTVGLPGWVTQRLWWALLITVGFWGLLRLAEALGIGSPGSRMIAAAAFALSPRVLTTIGAISSETLPMMLAPWVLLPVVLALRGTGGVRTLAARSALALALMGAVNAVATLTGCLPAIIWWACHRPNTLWARFTAWWALCAALAIAWWVVPLVMLGRISPPFLDFIESSGVTTQWTSLTEVLRGTDSWTPFVAPNATAGATLVTGTVAVLATTLVAAAGLAGLAMRTMPARGRLVTILLLGITLLAAGYAGGLGSPLAHAVQTFLDADGTPLRNVHKLEPLIRLPLVLGLAHLLGRIPLPGSVPRREWVHAFAHPENNKRVAVGMVVLVALATGTSLAWTGRLTPPGAFDAIPQYWHQTADWLDEHNTGSPPGRVLVAPGAPFATQVWGSSHDEPLQVLGGSPWGVRDSIPLTPPQTIRALDSVQRLFAAGRPSAGLADTLARQGISYVVVRNDLDPETSRSARPVLVHRAIDGSPGLSKVAEFGEQVGPGTLSGFISDSGLRPKYPAVEIFHVDATSPPGAPYLTDTDAMARVDGGPEALLRLDERRRLLKAPPLGPMLLTADAQRAGLADTRRHRHRHPAGPRNRLRPRRRPLVGDPRGRRHQAHLQPGARLPVGRHQARVRSLDRRSCLGVEFGGGLHRAAQRRARDRTHGGHRQRFVDELGVQFAAVRRRAVAAGRLRPRGHQRHHHHHAECDCRRRTGPPHGDLHRQRNKHVAVRRARQAGHRGAALRRDPVGPHHRHGHRRRIARRAVRHHRLQRHAVRRVGLRPADRAAPYRRCSRSAHRTPLSHNGISAPSCSAARAAPTGPTVCTARRPWRWHPRSR